MAMRKIPDSDFKELVALYKRFFKTHNIFSKPDEEIIEYLKKLKGECLLFDHHGILGAVYMVNHTTSQDGKHKLWKLKHLAFDSEDVGEQLLAEAEKRIKSESETAKIELNIAESEPNIDFYEENGYKKEAELKNHYRHDEACYVFSKMLS